MSPRISLWDWSLETYAQSGVPEACLALQDANDQNVCLLLWAAWAQVTEADVLIEAVKTARQWDAVVVAPLRRVRRSLKHPTPQMDDDAREQCRAQVKIAELAAERGLLQTLERLAEPRDGERRAALDAAVGAWGVPADPAAIDALAKALEARA